MSGKNSSIAFEGLCNHLHTATLCSTDLKTMKQFYIDVMGMQLEGPVELSIEQKETQRKLWGIPDDIDYDYYHIHRSAVPSLIKIRLIHLHAATPHIHHSYSSRELGSFSLGFPNGDIHQMDKRVEDGGFGKMADMQTGDVTRDGKTYPYYETIYKGPDYLHCVGLQRGGGMEQVSPIDDATNLGGPGYSAYVTNRSDDELDFYIKVLGLEVRFDWVWEASPGSALGIAEGVPFRFVSLYAKGSHQNHLLFLDYKDGIFEEINAPPRVPNQGLGMWTFETKDLDTVLQNIKDMKMQLGSGPYEHHDPILGQCRAATMLTPTGFLVEVFESK